MRDIGVPSPPSKLLATVTGMTGDPGESAAPQGLRIDESTVAGVDLISLTGEIDTFSGPQLDVALDLSLMSQSPIPIVVDLSKVTFIGSAGIALLVHAHTCAAEAGRILRVVIDTSKPPLTRPLSASGARDLLTIYDTLAAALAPD